MLTDRMMEASEKMEYEKAMEYRDLLKSVRHVAEKQKITSSQMEDRDIIAFARADDEAVVQVFFVRGGKLIGREHFYVTGVGSDSRTERTGESRSPGARAAERDSRGRTV